MKLAACLAAFFIATARARMSDSALEDRPFARVLAPAHFACLHGSSLGAQNGVLGLRVELELPAGVRGTSAATAVNGLVCVAVDGGPSGSTLAGAHAAKCAALDGHPRGAAGGGSDGDGGVVYEALPAPANLAPGCHVLTAWWQSRDGAEVGSAHPVLFRVPAVPGGACASSCASSPAAAAAGVVLEVAGVVAASSPSAVTGGCRPGDPRCCPAGCCEYVNLASQCSVFADGLPPCGSCLAGTAPPASPRDQQRGRASGAASELYLELVKRAVLDDLTPTSRGPPPQPPASHAGVHAAPGAAGAASDAAAAAAAAAAAEAQKGAEAAAAKVDGHVWPAEHAAALTMVGRRRLNHVHALVDDVVLRRVPGDVAECGCWRGGVAALAAAVLRAAGELCLAPDDRDGSSVSGEARSSSGSNSSAAASACSGRRGGGRRTVWLLDSFAGLPPPNLALYPLDAPHVGEVQTANAQTGGGLGANSATFVTAALQQLGVFDALGTRLVQGFFKDSLPLVLARGDLQTLSVLRLDGDLYESTIQALHYLYPSVSVGGHVIVDDFTDWVGCRRAVADYRLVRGLDAIHEPIQIVWHEPLLGEQVRGVWWTKAAARLPPADPLLAASSSRWHLDYDPLDPHGLQPEDYAAAAAEVRRLAAA